MPAIEVPTLLEPRRVTGEWTVLPSWLPVPGMGALPINSFVLRGSEPLLVDTGLGAFGDDYLAALSGEVDLDDLRWIWLSHMDADHIGNLGRVLEKAPNARILTNFLGMGKMNLAGLDVSRVDLLEPGAVVEIGGRRLHQLRPPYYDAPETMGFFDAAERVLFAADAFGALLPEPVSDIVEVPNTVLRDGLVGWSSIDAPWLGVADRDALGRTLTAIERLDPAIVLSGHLPLAMNGVKALTENVANAWCRGVTDAVDPNAAEHVAAAFA